MTQTGSIRRMIPDKIAPIIKGSAGDVLPALCRLSRDLAHVAFWVTDGDARGIFVGEAEWGEMIGEAAQRVWSTTDAHVSELAWSGDGKYLAFAISSGP